MEKYFSVLILAFRNITYFFACLFFSTYIFLTWIPVLSDSQSTSNPIIFLFLYVLRAEAGRLVLHCTIRLLLHTQKHTHRYERDNTEKHTLQYDSNYMTVWENQNCRDNQRIRSCKRLGLGTDK